MASRIQNTKFECKICKAGTGVRKKTLLIIKSHILDKYKLIKRERISTFYGTIADRQFHFI